MASRWKLARAFDVRLSPFFSLLGGGGWQGSSQQFVMVTSYRMCRIFAHSEDKSWWHEEFVSINWLFQSFNEEAEPWREDQTMLVFFSSWRGWYIAGPLRLPGARVAQFNISIGNLLYIYTLKYNSYEAFDWHVSYTDISNKSCWWMLGHTWWVLSLSILCSCH
jgi:hypothetical protein